MLEDIKILNAVFPDNKDVQFPKITLNVTIVKED